MTTAIYWFRNDLRLQDNPALLAACGASDYLLPIYIHQKHLEAQTQWGFQRVGRLRKLFLRESLNDLAIQLQSQNFNLFEFNNNILDVFQALEREHGQIKIYCEIIAAPEEKNQIRELRDAGFEVHDIWQSSMLDPIDMPFELQEMPDIFTQFRQKIEKARLRFAEPVQAPKKFPPLPSKPVIQEDLHNETDRSDTNKAFIGGESSAKAHMEQYFSRRLVDSYKKTRNQLIGMDYSSKFSPWLAQGNCSSRLIAERLERYEQEFGANEGTYWLWFELLWRDYFRFLHFKYENRLYREIGLSNQSPNPFNPVKFAQWSSGNTGESLIDAGMRELNQTGFLSNRMRQIVASYWIYDMQGDWQAGAAWFEAQLIDYDVYSNHGNWLYIAGKGTDPRGGRAFNVQKQSKDHDPDGEYRKMWTSIT